MYTSAHAPSYGVGGTLPLSAPPEAPLDRRVYDVLRAHYDAPRVVFSAQDVFIVRHNTLKKVVLASTRFYTYVIKAKGYKLYTRIANRRLTALAQQEVLVLSSNSSTGSAAAAAPRGLTGAVGGPLSGEERQESEFDEVKIECDSSLAAHHLADRLGTLALQAQRTAAQLELEERGGGGPAAAGGDKSNAAAAASDSEPSDDDGGGGEGDGGAAGGAVALRAARAAEARKGMLELAPSRYIAVTSLVDGEFADYSALKNAYTRHAEDELLADLAAFIKENEGQVERLCEHHYPAFLHATQQCLAISARDAQLVGEELGGASTLVKGAVVSMKQVAGSMLMARSTRENLAQTRVLLRRALAMVEYLETAEAQTRKEQLMGAVASVRELVRLSASMVDYALGEYVMRMRVPALTAQITEHAVHHMNRWLRLLRAAAAPMGAAALDWQGHVEPAVTAKRIVVSADGNEWRMEDCFVGSSVVPAAFEQAAAVRDIADGAAVQTVFQALRREDYFTRAYAEGRAQLLRADLVEAPLDTAAEALAVVAAFQQHCALALGFMLTEDVVFSATSPHAHSQTDILRVWDRLSESIAARVRRIADALAGDPSYAEHMTSVFEAIRGMMQCTLNNVQCVELSPLVLSRVVESVSDGLISRWLQGACMDCAQLILADTFSPLQVSSAAEFEAHVARFSLNRCPRLELPIPPAYTAGTMTLPFSPVVSAIGDAALLFLTRCYAVIITEQNSAFRQSELNNVDEMVLKYLSVLFRTVSETLQAQLATLGTRAVLQTAVFVTSCATVPALVTCVEQQFMLRWSGEYGDKARQVVGQPKLLAATAAFFAKPLQKGIEALLAALRAELEERLAPAATLGFWRRQVELRRGARKRSEADGNEGFGACVEHALALLPKLRPLLQSSVLRSVAGAALVHAGVTMQASIGTALAAAYADGERDFGAMREAVAEFEQQCEAGAAVWRRQLAQVVPEGAQLPLNAAAAAAELRPWIDAREQRYVVEKANQPQLLAGMETAGKAVAKGLQAVGKTVTATAGVFGKKE